MHSRSDGHEIKESCRKWVGDLGVAGDGVMSRSKELLVRGVLANCDVLSRGELWGRGAVRGREPEGADIFALFTDLQSPKNSSDCEAGREAEIASRRRCGVGHYLGDRELLDARPAAWPLLGFGIDLCFLFNESPGDQHEHFRPSSGHLKHCPITARMKSSKTVNVQRTSLVTASPRTAAVAARNVSWTIL
jgi:hypothetical protein